MSINIRTEWFAIEDEDNEYMDEKDDKNKYFSIEGSNISEKLEILEKRIEICEDINKTILKTLEELKKNIDRVFEDDINIKKQIDDIRACVKSNETSCNVIRNENLKLINRILEAEISIERSTNILLRKGISFPFTKINL
jgi:hypothetical protein